MFSCGDAPRSRLMRLAVTMPKCCRNTLSLLLRRCHGWQDRGAPCTHSFPSGNDTSTAGDVHPGHSAALWHHDCAERDICQENVQWWWKFMLLSRTFVVSLHWIFPRSLTLRSKRAVVLLSWLFVTSRIILCSTVGI